MSTQYPCRGCIYFDECGENMRTEPCAGRETKSDKKKEKRNREKPEWKKH